MSPVRVFACRNERTFNARIGRRRRDVVDQALVPVTARDSDISGLNVSFIEMLVEIVESSTDAVVPESVESSPRC